MAWINTGSPKLIFIGLLISAFPYSFGLDCGYPGSPAFGRPVPVRDSYRPGSSVAYSCAHGYTLRGTHQKTCLSNGTWTGIIPLCDQSLSGIDQHASSRATFRQSGADKVIDGNKDTCTYTDPIKPRWIRVDLQQTHLVESVAIAVPKNTYTHDAANFKVYVISVKNATTHPFTNVATYHKCAEFYGKFSTTTVKLSCTGGGFYGKYVHIDDQRNGEAYFSICEISVFVQKDAYECGEPDRPSNSYTSNPEAGVVEYRCVYGYQLEGHVRRRCLANGQWSGTQPLCLEIVCPPIPPISNGVIQYSGPVRGKPVQGTTANVTCDYGYQSSSGLAVNCEETGLWSEGELECQPVDCHVPVVRNGEERYILLNGSTTYGSMAFLYCGDERPVDGDETSSSIRICREDGSWSDSKVDCATSDPLETLGLVEEDGNTVPNGVIIGMAVIVFVLLLILIFILVFRRKQLSRRQSAESLPSKDTSSSLTVSEVKNGIPYENDGFYASITNDEPKAHESKSNSESTRNQPPVVERGILSTILFAKRNTCNNEKQKTRNESISSSSSTCFYEEIGLRSSGKKTAKQKKVISDDSSYIQPVYAQVDLDEKRKSRLAKASSPEHSDQTVSRQFGDTNTPENLSNEYRTEEAPYYDPELDSEPVMLRELPPIPDDDDRSSGTYASLSKPPEPPSSPTPVYMRENDIYAAGEVAYKQSNHHIMKENDVYATGNLGRYSESSIHSQM